VPHGHGSILPNVSPGDTIRPAVFHKLAEGIDRASLLPGAGVRINKTGGSSTISVVVPEQKDWFPFKASIIGAEGTKLLTIRLGQVFGGGFFNTWRSNNTVNWAGQVDYGSTPGFEGSHLNGSEIMIDIPGTNYISSTQLAAGHPLTFPLKAGVYYLEMAPWSGREVVGSDLPAGISSSLAVFNKYSKNLKGAVRPVIKFADATQMLTAFKTKTVMPICTVDKFERLFQTLSSDVFLASATVRPFTVYVGDCESASPDEICVVVTPGTVNRAIPTIDDKYLDQSPAPTLKIDNTGYIVIKSTHETGKIFPRKSEVIFVTGDDFDNEAFEDTTTRSYFPIAKVNMTAGDPVPGGEEGETGPPSYVIVQLNSSHLVVNRLKAGASTAAWIWDTL
jgi:hypothetical protein